MSKTATFRARTEPAFYEACRAEFERRGTSQAVVINQLLRNWMASDKPSRELPKPAAGPKTMLQIQMPRTMLKALHRRASAAFLPATVWAWAVLHTAVYGEPVPMDKEVTELRQVNHQLMALGRNLNQIARQFNIDAKQGKPTQLRDLRIDLLLELSDKTSELEGRINRVLSARKRDWGISE